MHKETIHRRGAWRFSLWPNARPCTYAETGSGGRQTLNENISGMYSLFFRQTIEAATMIGVSKQQKKNIINQVALAIPEFPLHSTPPEMGQKIHEIIRTLTGIKDPYAHIKQKSHEHTMRVLDVFSSKINAARNKILTAVELAIAGNSIDFGVRHSVDIKGEIEKIVRREERQIKKEDGEHFQFTGTFR